MDDWAELGRALGIIAGSGRAEVREDGKWLADFSPEIHVTRIGINESWRRELKVIFRQ
jgi:hypothetical protein